MDLILTTEAGVDAGGETLASEPLVWVGRAGRPGLAARGRCASPRARRCMFRRPALDALDAAGIPWELAVDSVSTMAVKASVAADLAVNVQMHERRCRPSPRSIRHGGALPELPELPHQHVRGRRSARGARRAARGAVAAGLRRARRASPPNRARSTRDDHLAGGAPVAQEIEAGIGLFQRQDVAHMRMQPALRVPAEERGEAAASDRGRRAPHKRPSRARSPSGSSPGGYSPGSAAPRRWRSRAAAGARRAARRRAPPRRRRRPPGRRRRRRRRAPSPRRGRSPSASRTWCAPAPRGDRLLPAPRATAITRAPISRPISTAVRPTPPEAPRTSSVSPGRSRASSGKRHVAGAVGDEKARHLRIRHRRGRRDAARGRHDQVFGKSAAAGEAPRPGFRRRGRRPRARAPQRCRRPRAPGRRAASGFSW